MKKLFICLSVISVLLVSCSKDYDDSALWDSVNGLENRVAKLEELCKQMNTNISSLQEIVKALKERESITNVSTLSDGSGYSITFTSGKTITIYHGKNGSDGSDGTNGVTPTISVKQDGDGIYYWTVNGNWLVVDGKKVKAIGTDGADGSNGNDGSDGTDGKDGITPKFKIDGGYWYISYDNEQNWERLGKATGDSGLNGEDGNAFFKGVSIANGFVVFTLNDEESTEIKIPFYSETELTVHITEPGTLKSLLTDEQMRTTLSLKVIGNINDKDIQTIDASMLVVENIDLSGTNIMSIGGFGYRDYNPSKPSKQTLKKIILPNTCTSIVEGTFNGCRNLQTVIAPGVTEIGKKAFFNCIGLENLTISALDKYGLYDTSFDGCPPITLTFSSLAENITPLTYNGTTGTTGYYKIPYKTLIIPTSVKSSTATLGNSLCENLIFESPSSLESLSEFGGCNIQSVEIPESVIRLESGAFWNCRALTTIIIPANSKLNYIAPYSSHVSGALGGCNNLAIVKCYKKLPPPCYKGAFCSYSGTVLLPPSLPINAKLYVPKGCKAAYAEYDGWALFEIIEMDE